MYKNTASTPYKTQWDSVMEQTVKVTAWLQHTFQFLHVTLLLKWVCYTYYEALPWFENTVINISTYKSS